MKGYTNNYDDGIDTFKFYGDGEDYVNELLDHMIKVKEGFWDLIE